MALYLVFSGIDPKRLQLSDFSFSSIPGEATSQGTGQRGYEILDARVIEGEQLAFVVKRTGDLSQATEVTIQIQSGLTNAAGAADFSGSFTTYTLRFAAEKSSQHCHSQRLQTIWTRARNCCWPD